MIGYWGKMLLYTPISFYLFSINYFLSLLHVCWVPSVCKVVFLASQVMLCLRDFADVIPLPGMPCLPTPPRYLVNTYSTFRCQLKIPLARQAFLDLPLIDPCYIFTYLPKLFLYSTFHDCDQMCS